MCVCHGEGDVQLMASAAACVVVCTTLPTLLALLQASDATITYR